MWICKNCQEKHKDNFGSCWKCQTDRIKPEVQPNKNPLTNNIEIGNPEEISTKYHFTKNNKGVIDRVVLNYGNGQVYLIGERLKKGNGHFKCMLIKTYHLNGQQKSEGIYNSRGEGGKIKSWDEKGNFIPRSKIHSNVTHSNLDLSYKPKPPSKSLVEIVHEKYI